MASRMAAPMSLSTNVVDENEVDKENAENVK